MNLRASTAFDGVYTTSTGETVHISVSDQLVPDEAENQAWAEYLASLPHGKELASVQLYIAPRTEVRQLCGRDALACYYGESQRIVFPAEDRLSPPSRQSILAHEYGHQIERNRMNTPWPGLVYGTKRWATYTQVCEGLREGRLSLNRVRGQPVGDVRGELPRPRRAAPRPRRRAVGHHRPEPPAGRHGAVADRAGRRRPVAGEHVASRSRARGPARFGSRRRSTGG